MSFIVKEIDLPKEMKEAESVDMIIYYNGNRFVKEINPSRFVEIPSPHGRLIDADDIYIGRWDIDSDLAEQIQNAPTILEAER